MSQPKSSSSSPLITPSTTIKIQPISALQITELYQLLGTALCKATISSDLVQRVMDDYGDLLATDFVALMNNRIEIVTGFQRLRVKVDRMKTAQEAIDAVCDRHKSVEISAAILAAAPKNECAATKKLNFFTIGREANNDEVRQKYEKLGLRPADVWEICAFNAKYPNFATDRPNAVHFQDADGKWWYCAIGVGDGTPYIAVNYVIRLWEDGWWFMGLPKE